MYSKEEMSQIPDEFLFMPVTSISKFLIRDIELLKCDETVLVADKGQLPRFAFSETGEV
jgi:hypothetical protein